MVLILQNVLSLEQPTAQGAKAVRWANPSTTAMHLNIIIGERRFCFIFNTHKYPCALTECVCAFVQAPFHFDPVMLSGSAWSGARNKHNMYTSCTISHKYSRPKINARRVCVSDTGCVSLRRLHFNGHPSERF